MEGGGEVCTPRLCGEDMDVKGLLLVESEMRLLSLATVCVHYCIANCKQRNSPFNIIVKVKVQEIQVLAIQIQILSVYSDTLTSVPRMPVTVTETMVMESP